VKKVNVYLVCDWENPLDEYDPIAGVFRHKEDAENFAGSMTRNRGRQFTVKERTVLETSTSSLLDYNP
jgi:hypothetical protein